MDSAACILDAFWTDLAISTERTAVSDTAATAEANSLFILASVQIVVLQSCDRPLCAKSGRLLAISQVLRERRSIGSDCQASNCWCREQGGYACSRWFCRGARPTLTANEQRPSRSWRRRDRANGPRDALACVPSPRYRDDDHGIELGVHRWFGRECWATGDRSELSCGRHRPAMGRQCLFASLERAPFAGRSSGRPVRPPSSLDRGRSAVRHRFSNLRGGADPYPLPACSVRAGCERRHTDAKQPRDPRPEVLWM